MSVIVESKIYDRYFLVQAENRASIRNIIWPFDWNFFFRCFRIYWICIAASVWRLVTKIKNKIEERSSAGNFLFLQKNHE